MTKQQNDCLSIIDELTEEKSQRKYKNHSSVLRKMANKPWRWWRRWWRWKKNMHIESAQMIS